MNRITLLLFCLLFVLYQKDAYARLSDFTIKFEAQSLRSALCELGEMSQIQFIFQDEVPNALVITNQRFENKSLSQILDTLLANTGYSYVIIGGHRYEYEVVIYRTSETIQCQEPVLITITGRVVDYLGEPMPGVGINIRREDGSIGNWREPSTFTNLNGNFKITVDNPNTYLVFLFISYLPRVVHIKDAELIQLELDDRPFAEPVIIGGRACE